MKIDGSETGIDQCSIELSTNYAHKNSDTTHDQQSQLELKSMFGMHVTKNREKKNCVYIPCSTHGMLGVVGARDQRTDKMYIRFFFRDTMNIVAFSTSHEKMDPLSLAFTRRDHSYHIM